MKRATRLLPALSVLLIVYAVVVVQEGRQLSSLGRMYGSILLWITNWHAALGWSGFDARLGHLWSLAVEEQFYLVWPFIFIGLRRLGHGRVLVVLAAACTAVGLWRAHLYGSGVPDLVLLTRTDTCIDGVILGCFAAFLTRTWSPTPIVSRAMALAGAFTVGAFLSLTSPHARVPYVGGLSLFSVASAILIIGLVTNVRPHRVLDNPVLRAVGRCSYGAYLWHILVFTFVADHGGGLNPIPRVVLAIVVTACITAASWRFVENPAMRLRERLLPHAPNVGMHESMGAAT